MDSNSVGTLQAKPIPLPRKSNRNFTTSRDTKSLSPKPSLTDTPSDINSNIDNLMDQKPNISKFSTSASPSTGDSPPPLNKPVPLPRKFVKSNGTSTTSSSPSHSITNMPDLTNFSPTPNNQSIAGSVKSEDYEDDMDDDIDYENIPCHPNLQNQQQNKESEAKRTTINLFKRVVGDPFEDFENSIKEDPPLSTITFRSPIEDLDEAAKSRISISSLSSSTTTTSKTSSDYSDSYYMEPPPARPVLPMEQGGRLEGGNKWRHSGCGSIPHSAFSSNTVPSKPKRSPNIILPRLSSLEEGETMSSGRHQQQHGSPKKSLEKVSSLPSSECYEPISSYSSSGKPVKYIDSSKKFHTISSSSTKDAIKRNSGNHIISSNNLSNSAIAEYDLPINSNFSNSKRVTVPNIDRVLAGNIQSSLNNHHASLNASSHHNHPRQSESIGKTAHRKFDPTAYDISDLHHQNNDKSGEKGRIGTPPKSRGNVGPAMSAPGSNKRLSFGTNSPPTGSQELKNQSETGSDRSAPSSVILRRHSSSSRSTCSSNSTGSRPDSHRKSKKVHEYDDVAIEDGTVVFLSQPHHRNSSSDSSSTTTFNNNSCSSFTSRNSVVQEFDPLFDARSNHPLLATGFPVGTTPLDLNDTQQHRYEYIDHEGDDGQEHPCHGLSANGKIQVHTGIGGSMCMENPGYSPSTPRSSREIKVIDEMYEPIGSPKEGISPKLSPKPRMGTRVLRSKTDEFIKHGVLPPTPSPPVIPEDGEMPNSEKPRASLSDSTAVPTVVVPAVSPPSSGQQTQQSQSNFFRKFSSKFRLNAIKEEKDDKKVTESLLSAEETYGSITTPCKKCCEPHPESTKCKFVPQYRQNIVYSSHLYKTTGISKKEFAKKWGVLAKAKLTFYNDKSEVITEIPLEKFSVVSKRNDYKLLQSQSDLKCFELGLSGGKSCNYVFASGSEDERCAWMQKLLEVYTSAFPPTVLKNFDRGGWCFIKETVTSDWRPCWLVLKGRSLYYSYWKGDESYEMDLRKARSIALSQKEDEYKCPYLENAEVLTVDFICKLLYIQTENSKVTASWEKAIKIASSYNGSEFLEMQLTLDNVPVIVDKCIDFLYAHGTLSEGIYRQSGSNTRITQLLQDFKNDSWSVQISHKEFSAHDVAGTLKRFFRTLPEPLVTVKLYDEWIKASSIIKTNDKMAEYQRLLEELPEINYNIMKKLICHLYAVHELHEKNLMPLLNLAPIWGPTLMNVDTSKLAQSYQIAGAECEVVKDLIENYYFLFRVDPQEIAREKKMQDALENFHLGSCKRKCSGDMKIWIYVFEKDETSPINVTLTPNSTTHLIVQQICTMNKLKNVDNLTLHEVICNESLERPLHPTEKVIETVLRWSIWDSEERKTNYLILKKNTLYPSLVHYAKEAKSISGELKYADSKSKSFRKFTFQFSQAAFKYYKDSKSTTELGSWKIEDMVWYMGCEPKRNAPTRWTFTFVKRNYPFKRSKEEPFFGNVVVCASEDELHKWIGAMVIGEHPEGLNPIIV